MSSAYTPLTLEEVAKMLGVSKARVRDHARNFGYAYWRLLLYLDERRLQFLDLIVRMGIVSNVDKFICATLRELRARLEGKDFSCGALVAARAS